jgi:hypothetical protein
MRSANAEGKVFACNERTRREGLLAGSKARRRRRPDGAEVRHCKNHCQLLR